MNVRATGNISCQFNTDTQNDYIGFMLPLEKKQLKVIKDWIIFLLFFGFTVMNDKWCITPFFNYMVTLCLSKFYDVPVGFVPPPYFEAVYCFICRRRRVAIARYRMICLVLFITIF